MFFLVYLFRCCKLQNCKSNLFTTALEVYAVHGQTISNDVLECCIQLVSLIIILLYDQSTQFIRVLPLIHPNICISVTQTYWYDSFKQPNILLHIVNQPYSCLIKFTFQVQWNTSITEYFQGSLPFQPSRSNLDTYKSAFASTVDPKHLKDIFYESFWCSKCIKAPSVHVLCVF